MCGDCLCAGGLADRLWKCGESMGDRTDDELGLITEEFRYYTNIEADLVFEEG